jgi:putative methyltransferase (TIGR04325 family)
MTAHLPEWEYIPEGWRKEDPRAQGWNHPSVAQVMNQKWPEFSAVVESVRPLGIYPLAPNLRSESGHNLSMTFGYVLARAAHGKSRLSILDWGGGLGHYALMAQRLLPDAALDITVKELPDVCRIGRALLPTVTFETDDEKCFARRYDLAMASSSLQYTEDWRGVAGRLAKSAAGWIFITRLSLVRKARSFTVVQRPYAYGYRTEYISWVLNRDEFLSHMAAHGAILEREFIAGGDTQYAGAPETSETVGFLFRAPA